MSARGQTRMTKNENASPSKECLQGLCGNKMFMTLTNMSLIMIIYEMHLFKSII